ncbi:MAG: hypothetical protein JWN39_1883 [Ilumatobacteraceae bacterium]|nr:hypothetical protein [Ilumatobacteraceae bacterium]
MFPIPNPLDLFGDAISSVTGWAWGKVIEGIYTWFANGLLMLMEWVWGVLDTATTPRLTDAWFADGLVRPIAAISLSITIALMLASAVQAGFGGRPELIGDALKEGPKSIVATALTIVVMDVMIKGADVIGDVAWQAGRADAMAAMDRIAATIGSAGALAGTFLGPLALLFGMIGLLVTTVVLFMRSSLLYVVAAFAPIVWSSSVAPMMRGSGRRLVQVTVALVLAKPAITITLVVGVKLLANGGTASSGGDGAAALGVLISGFSCFAIAGLSPWVVYRLLPTVESATVGTGIVGGWGRSAMTAANVGMMSKSAGTSAAASAESRSQPQMTGAAGGGAQSGFAGAATETAGAGSRGSRSGATAMPSAAASPFAASRSPGAARSDSDDAGSRTSVQAPRSARTDGEQ